MRPTSSFGKLLRDRRLIKVASDPSFSLRQMANRVGIEPSYLSKIERGEQPPPGEETICRIANPTSAIRLRIRYFSGVLGGKSRGAPE